MSELFLRQSNMKKWVRLQLLCGKTFKISWYPGTSSDDIEYCMRAVSGFGFELPFILLDPEDDLLATAISESLPVGNTFMVQSEYGQRVNDISHGPEEHKANFGQCDNRLSSVYSAGEGEPSPQRLPSSESEPLRSQWTSVQDVENTTKADIEQGADRWLKFERLLSHLANERTLLGWFRTAVSLLSITFAFVELGYDTDLIDVGWTTVMATIFCLVSVYLSIVGIQRSVELRKSLLRHRFRIDRPRLSIRHTGYLLHFIFFVFFVFSFVWYMLSMR